MMRTASLLSLVTVATLLGGCDNAGKDLALPTLRTGAIGVLVYIDRDGTGSLTSFDTTYSGARVALFAPGGIDTVATATSDSVGLAEFDSIPVGRYRFAVVTTSLGDSLPVVKIIGDSTFRLIVQPDSIAAGSVALVSRPTLTIAEARSGAPGRKVFVHGKVNSALQFFPDSATYLTDGSKYLRIIPSHHRPGRSGNNLGDSVIVEGTIGVVAGQPVLIDGAILTVGEGAVPVTVDIGVADVAHARGGSLDAAVVSIDSAEITDTATVGAFFEIGIARDGDSALVRVDSTLRVPKSAFAPGRGLRVRGVMVPLGDGTWYIRPRPVNGDIELLG